MSWQDDQILYWANNTNPMVAITSTCIHGIDHATGTVTGVQIGDQTGILPGLCTGLITAGTCAESQNCIWGRDHKNVYNNVPGTDRLLFVACRPVTLGIAFVASGVAAGTPVTWFSTARSVWLTGVVTVVVNGAPVTFADGITAAIGYLEFSGTQAISGDSGSPVFTSDGDFVASVGGISGADTVAVWAYPSGSQTRTGAPTDVFTGSPYDFDED